MTRSVDLPDGREIEDGNIISYDDIDDEPRMFRITIDEDYYAAEAVGDWATWGAGENVGFDSRREFIDWCMGPEPPESVNVPQSFVESVLKRLRQT